MDTINILSEQSQREEMGVVALIRGPFISVKGSINNEPTPPIGLAYLAGTLASNGYAVQGIDAVGEDLFKVVDIPSTELQYNGLGIEEIVNMVDSKVAVIGISVMFSHEWVYNRDLIDQLKAAFPAALIVGGGEHFTAMTEYSLRDCHALDYIVLGEGEETILDFCDCIASGRSPVQIEGIAYMEGDRYVLNPARKRIRGIDEIPWPNWDVFPLKHYLDTSKGGGPSFGRNMPLVASRGCPYECTFCSNRAMWGNRYILRQPEDVLAEIKHCIEKYNITGMQFYDLTMIVNKEWTIKFCQMLVDNGITLAWSLPSGTRSEALDDEALGALARANCRYLVYAPESGSEETLKLIKKKIKLDKFYESIRLAIKNKIVVRTNIIIGFPHETRRQVFATLKMQMKLTLMGIDEAPLYLFQPYPGTELFTYLLDKKTIELNDDYFIDLATLSTGNLRPPDRTYCEHVGKTELYIYRLVGQTVFLMLTYIIKPFRIFHTLNNILFGNTTSTVFEQRIKDRLMKSPLRPLLERNS
jgi:anaerobic magnesium-protoporphyrin IX monomethyl ester cyclase